MEDKSLLCYPDPSYSYEEEGERKMAGKNTRYMEKDGGETRAALLLILIYQGTRYLVPVQNNRGDSQAKQAHDDTYTGIDIFY